MADVLSSLRVPVNGSSKPGDGWDCPAFAKQYPNLFELMSRIRFDGQERSVTRLTFFVKEGELRCCLNSPDEGYYQYVHGVDFEDPWGFIENHLRSTASNWERSKYSDKD